MKVLQIEVSYPIVIKKTCIVINILKDKKRHAQDY